MSAIIELSDDTFQEEVLHSKVPVIVDFAAEWCGPCKRMLPILEEIATEYQNRVKVCHVDIDKCPDIESDHSILSVPTLMFFKDGEQFHQIVGLSTKAALVPYIEQAL